MADESIQLTREELYHRLWSNPATQVGKELGISQWELSRICKKFRIPKPYPGYWQQLEAGRQVQVPPLPELPEKSDDVVEIRQGPVTRSLTPEGLPRPEQDKQENESASHIRVAEDLRNPHPLVRQAKHLLEKGFTDNYGLLRPPYHGESCLDVRVTKTSLHRALRIMDALLKVLEAKGYQVEVSKSSTQVLVGEERVDIHISEKVDRSERQSGGNEKGYVSRWVYAPSGRLTFHIDEFWPQESKKKWSDSARQVLEDQVDGVIPSILRTAEALRLVALERQAQALEWRAAELRRQEEEQFKKSIDEQSDLWQKGQRIRAFLQEAERLLAEGPEGIGQDSPAAQWLRRGHAYADRLDPFTNGQFERMIQRLLRDEPAKG